MTTYEERQALLRTARELITTLNEHNKTVNGLINKLIGEADSLALSAADEKSAGENITKRSIKFTGTVTAPEIRAALPLPKGKRACSLCREPGHRATNCPNAHLMRKPK